MRKRVKYSGFCWLMTTLALALTGASAAYAVCSDAEPWIKWVIGVGVAMMVTAPLLYAPVSISVDAQRISIRRPLMVKHIPLSEVAAVRMCPPTMAESKLCGSSAYFGYWGWFSQTDTGRYFAYYGKASDCFLITMRDGRKYLLGCNDGASMAGFISRLAGV